MLLTADCEDPEFGEPSIDSEQDLSAPIPHRKVAGHFDGTDRRFTIYLPPREQWQGRFFQHVYPLIDENADDRNIEFAAASGGYLVQTNGGSGYRVDAAAAKFAKKVAAEHYRFDGRIFGYIWGGSGGSYQVIAAMENTVGVWDGGVPFIVGDPSSIPNNFFARAFGRLLLSAKASDIGTAVGAGESSDPYGTLDPVERSVLSELSNLGVPMRAWEDYRYLLGMDAPDGLFGFADQIKTIDPTYVDDFWSKPGYLGTEQSPLGDRIRAAATDTSATVTDIAATKDRVTITLESSSPLSSLTPVDVTVPGHDAVSATVHSPTTVSVPASAAEIVHSLATGATVRVDNRWYVALSSYARHQIPDRDGFAGYDQYRRPDGTPKYPQRPVWAGGQIAKMVSGGGTHTGKINGKVIAVANLLDVDAFPWHADWYRHQVRSALGAGEPDSFRLWYTDNADHIAPARTERLIDYTGVLEQTLRDLTHWVEKGRSPATSTQYTVSNGQVNAASATEHRGGIQPAVSLAVTGGRVVAHVGETIRVDADIDTNGATLVKAQWLTTDGAPATAAKVSQQPVQRISETFSYDKPGTYHPQIRVITSREEPPSEFAQLSNLARVEVTVVD